MQTEKAKIYHIHDNYNRPYRVKIIKLSTGDNKKYKVLVYEKKFSENHDDTYHDTPAYEFDTDRIFIGKSGLTRMTEYSGGHGPDFDGNTILLHGDKNRYIHIGWQIFVFDADSEIVTYKSPVGNNDVPYPHAVDRDGNIYLLVENVVLVNSKNLQKRMRKYDDPYDYYYDYNLITTDNGTVPPTKPKVKNFNDIAEYYIGNEPYTLRYEPEPDTKYDRLIPGLGDTMYTVDTSGKKTRISKPKYIDLMKKFGEYMGFQPIKNRQIIQKLLKTIY